MLVMAGWLRRIGYRAYLSGIDWNIGCPNRTGQLLGWRLAHIVRKTGSPIVIVGHSLGGLLARFLGVHFPERVCQVVALGSPIHSPSKAIHPVVQLAFRILAPPECSNPQCPGEFIQNVSSPLPQGVGCTAIFSKQDEVVDWRACLDPQGDNQEVSGRHASLIVHSEVYRILADILAACSQRKERRATQQSTRQLAPAEPPLYDGGFDEAA